MSTLKCTHCGGTVMADRYGLSCLNCGRRPDNSDPGPGPEAANLIGSNRPGAEHHSKGGISA